MSENLKLGQLISTEQHRDAVHIAVAPVHAGERLTPGQRLRLADGVAYGTAGESIGVADPFLRDSIPEGAQFWLFLNPGSITSLRHEWTHPAFGAQDARSISEKWMRAWAVEHMNYDYDYDGDLPEHMAYAKAIGAGFSMSVGCCESARDHIDNEWWAHWEAITGQRGKRGEYFSCAC